MVWGDEDRPQDQEDGSSCHGDEQPTRRHPEPASVRVPETQDHHVEVQDVDHQSAEDEGPDATVAPKRDKEAEQHERQRRPHHHGIDCIHFTLPMGRRSQREVPATYLSLYYSNILQFCQFLIQPKRRQVRVGITWRHFALRPTLIGYT